MVTAFAVIAGLVVGYIVGYVVGQTNGWDAARSAFSPAKPAVKVPVTPVAKTASPVLATAKAKPAKRGRPVGKKKASKAKKSR